MVGLGPTQQHARTAVALLLLRSTLSTKISSVSREKLDIVWNRDERQSITGKQRKCSHINAIKHALSAQTELRKRRWKHK